MEGNYNGEKNKNCQDMTLLELEGRAGTWLHLQYGGSPEGFLTCRQVGVEPHGHNRSGGTEDFIIGRRHGPGRSEGSMAGMAEER